MMPTTSFRQSNFQGRNPSPRKKRNTGGNDDFKNFSTPPSSNRSILHGTPSPQTKKEMEKPFELVFVTGLFTQTKNGTPYWDFLCLENGSRVSVQYWADNTRPTPFSDLKMGEGFQLSGVIEQRDPNKSKWSYGKQLQHRRNKQASVSVTKTGLVLDLPTIQTQTTSLETILKEQKFPDGGVSRSGSSSFIGVKVCLVIDC